jgi:hypothetical protein
VIGTNLPLATKPEFRKREALEINPKTWRIFPPRKSDCQNTTVTTHSTMFSPSKIHHKNTLFRKIPLKNTSTPLQKKIHRKGCLILIRTHN